jgi:hypothetical protein
MRVAPLHFSTEHPKRLCILCLWGTYSRPQSSLKYTLALQAAPYPPLLPHRTLLVLLTSAVSIYMHSLLPPPPLGSPVITAASKPHSGTGPCLPSHLQLDWFCPPHLPLSSSVAVTRPDLTQPNPFFWERWVGAVGYDPQPDPDLGQPGVGVLGVLDVS